MTITLPSEVESRLKAEGRGVDPSQFASEIIRRALPGPTPTDPPVPDQATIDLLNRWEAEDYTDDPEELARRQKEGEEFMQNLARNRREMEGPSAKDLWP